MLVAFLGAVLVHDLSHECSGKQMRIGAAAWALLSGFLYFIALVSYEAAIAFPALILLWDWHRRRDFATPHAWMRYGLIGLFTLAALWSQTRAGSNLRMANPSFSPMTPRQTILASAFFVFEHLRMWLAPFGRQEILGTFVWGNTASVLHLVLCWILLGALLACACGLRHRARMVSFGLLWFLIAFLPTSNLIPIQSGPFGDYYLVLPSIGLSLAVAGGLSALWNKMSIASNRAKWIRVTLRICFLCVVLWRAAAAIAAFEWGRVWNDPQELLRRSATVRPYSFKAKANLARLLEEANKLDDAEPLAQQSLAEAPWYALSHNVLGDIEIRRGNYQQALRYYESAVAVSPEDPYPYVALAFASETYLNDTDTAKKYYRKVLASKWNPQSETAALNLSRLLAGERNVEEAIGLLESALKQSPASMELHYNLAIAYEQKGDRDKAKEHQNLFLRLRQQSRRTRE